MIPEPTQEQRERADEVTNEFSERCPPVSLSSGEWGLLDGLIAAALAAEAAPLREEIERLTKLQEATALERERTGAELAIAQDAAEAKVLSLEAEIEKLRQTMVNAFGQGTNETHLVEIAHDLERVCAERDAALAAASRAREEQGALRAALERWGIIQSHGDEEDDGRAYSRCRCCGVIAWDSKPIHHKNKCEVGAALAPPAAESQENQQQLTGKGEQ